MNIVVAIVMVVGIGALVYVQKQSSSSLVQVAPAAATSSSASTVALMDRVPSHNSRESCWTIINGAVYDLTSWIPMHPGGERAILQLCGTDGSAKFNAQHGGQTKQATVLAGFKIGSAGDTSASEPSVKPAPAASSGGSGEGSGEWEDEDD